MAVASANLARLRELLGEPTASTLVYTPLDYVVASPQTHERFAISFMFLFGTIQDKSTGRQERIWVLLYPPRENNGPAELQFQSYDATSGTCNRFANENISTMMMEIAPAFKFKRGSRAKYESLAKYYFLEKLASQKGDVEELQVEMYISRGMLDGLKNACTEFKKQSETEMPFREPLSDSVTLLGDPDEAACSPRSEFSLVILTPKASRPRFEPSHIDKVNVLNGLRSKEAELDVVATDIDKQLLALKESRVELDNKFQKLEQERSKNREEKTKIVAQYEDVFKNMTRADTFALGREFERTRPAKRQRQD